MMFWRENPARTRRDREEIEFLQERYGEALLQRLAERAQSPGISAKSRRHWQRLHRKAQLMAGRAVMLDGAADGEPDQSLG